jgi:hypothetical protein
MNELSKQYDIIFFRNAFIYFTPNNRLIVLDNIAECLSPDGLFFPGISEISSVKHPLLACKNSNDVFYFQKISGVIKNYKAVENKSPVKQNEESQARELPVIKTQKPSELKTHLNVKNEDVIAILGKDEGKSNSENIMNILNERNDAENGQSRFDFSGSELAACAAYKLSVQDYRNADKAITELEKYNSDALAGFLRGEYFFSLGDEKNAWVFFEEIIRKDKTFRPTFYRITILSAQGNRDRYNYR